MDNAVESLEYYDYRPAVTERIDDWSADFPIEAYNDDVVTQPSRSLLVFQGRIEVTKDEQITILTDITN